MSSTMNNLPTKSNLSLDLDVDFRTLILGLWENKLLIFGIVSIISIVAMTYTLLKVPLYEANALVQIDSKTSSDFNLTKLTLGQQSSNATATQIALIKSRFILEPVVKQLGLDVNIKIKQSFFSKLWSHQNEQTPIKKLLLPSSYFHKPLTLIFIRPNYFILKDNNEVLIEGETGKTLSNKLKGIFVEIANIGTKPGTEYEVTKSSSIHAINDLTTQLNILELGEGSSKTGILQISLKHNDKVKLVNILNTITSIAQTKSAEHKAIETQNILNFLEEQLPIIKASLNKAESALNQYRATNAKIDIQLESRALMAQFNNVEKMITNTTMQKIAWSENYTPKHPFMIEINSKINELEKQKVILQNKIKKLPASDQLMVELLRDVSVKNKLYLTLLTRIHELRVNKAAMASEIQILSQATVPDGPLSKQASVVFAASLILGLIIGCLTVIARKAFFRRITDSHWVENNFNIPNWAIIPYSKIQANNLNSFKKKETKSLEILAEKFPRDLSIEALRSLRTSLQIVLAGAVNNIISLTGVSPSTGKSFISVNFAYLIAELGKKVLLIDGDIRKGYLQNYFKVNRAPGLSEVLLGSTTFEKALKTCANKNLFFLPSGSFPLNPADLLSGENFQNLMKKVSAEFDLVVIDTAPVLAATDSALIGAIASTNLMVIASNAHPQEEIILAFKRLENAGVKIQGTVFNYLKPETNARGNYQYKYEAESVT